MLRFFKPIETASDYLEKVISLNDTEIKAIANELDFNLLRKFVYTDLAGQRKKYDIKQVDFDKLLLIFKSKSLTHCMLGEYYFATTQTGKRLLAADCEMNEADFTAFIAIAKEAYKERLDYDRVVRITNEVFADRAQKAFASALRLDGSQ